MHLVQRPTTCENWLGIQKKPLERGNSKTVPPARAEGMSHSNRHKLHTLVPDGGVSRSGFSVFTGCGIPYVVNGIMGVHTEVSKVSEVTPGWPEQLGCPGPGQVLVFLK